MHDLFSDYNRFGIFGASESGKTTLAHRVSQEIFSREGRWTIALVPMDKNVDGWGKHTRVFRNRDQFLSFVRSTNNCLVAVEDASVTIAGDKDVTDLFTCLRHQNHKLLVIGHHPSNLSPQMRDSIQRIFLFCQHAETLDYWQKIFLPDLSPACRLQQYEFLTAANWKPVLISKLKK